MAPCNRNKTINAIRQFFDERAAGWDTMISEAHPRRLKHLVGSLGIPRNAHILDVGCGTGVLYPILAKLLAGEGVVAAFDLSGAMMRETRRRILASARHDLNTPALPLQADAIHPPFRDASFDWILCNSCFPHFHDQQQALCVMARLLRPGGRLVICHTESRDAINALHRKVGHVVGGHELPDATAFAELIGCAGLSLETLNDRPDAYLLVASLG